MNTKRWLISRFFTQQQFFNYKENREDVLAKISLLPFISSLANMLVTYFTGDYKKLGLVVYLCILLTPLTSIFSCFLLKLKKTNWAIISTFILLPIVETIVVLPQHTPILFTFPLLFATTAFFILEKKAMILITYCVCSICMFVVGYDLLTNNNKLANIILYFFDFLIFDIIFYFMFNFIRNFLMRSLQQIKTKQLALSNQNLELEKKSQKILIQSEKLKINHKQLVETTDFNNRITTILSNDIKDPIISIKNIFSSYSNGSINETDFLKAIPNIEKEINFISAHFEAMLLWSKKQNVEEDYLSEQANIYVITNEIFNLYSAKAKDKKISLLNNVKQIDYQIAKTKYLKIILQNLVSNAIKFTDFCGTVAISAVEENGKYKILVEDTGEGISAEKLKLIHQGVEFSTKGTQNETGIGYGLVLCKELIVKSGGEFLVASMPNRGSTFSVTLPIFYNKNGI